MISIKFGSSLDTWRNACWLAPDLTQRIFLTPACICAEHGGLWLDGLGMDGLGLDGLGLDVLWLDCICAELGGLGLGILGLNGLELDGVGGGLGMAILGLVGLRFFFVFFCRLI